MRSKYSTESDYKGKRRYDSSGAVAVFQFFLNLIARRGFLLAFVFEDTHTATRRRGKARRARLRVAENLRFLFRFSGHEFSTYFAATGAGFF
jgi:hypothetical protein